MNAANAPAATIAARMSPAQARPRGGGDAQDDRVGVAGDVELGRERAAEQAVDGGEQVEDAEQAEHADGRPARRRAVRVGVEADEDVRQAHRPEERRQQQRVDQQRRAAAGLATPGRDHSSPVCASMPAATGTAVSGGRRSSPAGTIARLAGVGERQRARPVEVDHHAVRAGARQLVAEQRGPRGQSAEVDQQQDRGERDREHLDPVLEGLHVGDAAHPAEHDVERDDRRPRSPRPTQYGAPVTARSVTPAPLSCGTR